MKTPEHLKIKLMAAAERRQVNQMYRELVLRAVEDAEAHRQPHRRPTRADREFPDVPHVREHA